MGSPACPASPPTVGGTCPIQGAECEYGSNPNSACNQVFLCSDKSEWTLETGSTCPTGTCPATYSDVPQNMSCTPNGLDCAYSQGQCNCTMSLPIVGGATWKCFDPNGCPEPRPDLGTPCTGSQSCDYGACNGGIEVECADGYWKQEEVPCPG
jgi:hypothetical protein